MSEKDKNRPIQNFDRINLRDQLDEWVSTPEALLDVATKLHTGDDPLTPEFEAWAQDYRKGPGLRWATFEYASRRQLADILLWEDR